MMESKESDMLVKNLMSLDMMSADGNHFNFIVKIYNAKGERSCEVDNLTRESFEELSTMLATGLALSSTMGTASLTASLTHACAFFHSLLMVPDTASANIKCILAATYNSEYGIRLVLPQSVEFSSMPHPSIVSEHLALVADLGFSASRMSKASLKKLNIYRFVHCLHEKRKMRSFYYAVYTVLLQLCLFSYIAVYALQNPPDLQEVWRNGAFAILVTIYEILTAAEYIHDALLIRRTVFWGPRLSIMQVSDFLANILIPTLLVPVSMMAVLHALDTLSATLTAASILFIPMIDNQILQLIGFQDHDIVKKYATRRTVKRCAEYFYKHSGGSGGSNSIPGISRIDAQEERAKLRQEMGSGFSYTPTIEDMVLTGERALLQCKVFEVYSNPAVHLAADTALWNDFQGAYFSETKIITPQSLFTRLEYALDSDAPYNITYFKLWRLTERSEPEIVQYFGNRYQPCTPINRIEAGCFIITNVAINSENGGIETLRICFATSPEELLLAMEFYMIFPVASAAHRMLRTQPRGSSSSKINVHGIVSAQGNNSDCHRTSGTAAANLSFSETENSIEAVMQTRLLPAAGPSPSAFTTTAGTCTLTGNSVRPPTTPALAASAVGNSVSGVGLAGATGSTAVGDSPLFSPPRSYQSTGTTSSYNSRR